MEVIVRSRSAHPKSMHPSAPLCAPRGDRSVKGRGFTLMDLMVSITIIAVLIGLLLPSISKINETTRRVICRSNMRQVSIGVSMYAQDNSQFLPRSQFVTSSGRGGRAASTVLMRSDESGGTRAPRASDYDGLGRLFAREYINAPKVFYCPSSAGQNTFAKFAPQWAGKPGVINGNFQFRGTMADGSRILNTQNEFAMGALISDSLVSIAEFSHKTGLNVMRGDLSVSWLEDSEKKIIAQISKAGNRDRIVDDTWPIMDQALGFYENK